MQVAYERGKQVIDPRNMPTTGERWRGCESVSPRLMFTTRWTMNCTVKNVLRTVWNLLSVAIGAIVDAVSSTILERVFCCHTPGCGIYETFAWG